MPGAGRPPDTVAARKVEWEGGSDTGETPGRSTELYNILSYIRGGSISKGIRYDVIKCMANTEIGHMLW